MPEENLNSMGDAGIKDATISDFSTIENRDINSYDVENQGAQTDSLQNISTDNLNIDNNLLDSLNSVENIDMFSDSGESMQTSSNVFLDSGDDSITQKRQSKDGENMGKYLRLFFVASVISTLGVIAIIILYSFNIFISKASQNNIDPEYAEFIQQYKDKLGKVKNLVGKNNIDNYPSPILKDNNAKTKVNEIINAIDIDFIEKKDLLKPFVSELVNNSEGNGNQIEVIKQDIAKQGFLPDELSQILSEKQSIDTIQRSLSALEVIKFSTAIKVFSYMDSAITTISEMVRVPGASIDAIGELLNQINSRGEKDISAYVYMCYLNPFETSVNCDTIGDLDLYYSSIIKDSSLNIRLFKNVMNAINQILEKEDTALFSITFNGFNAQDKDITFSVEVYTNQNDERSLMAKGKKNPNIFILTNIVNLLKQSSFIIGENIFTKKMNVDVRTITLGGLTTKVNYSNMDFKVPIQRNTEREIFDYIDLDSIEKLLNSLKKSPEDNITFSTEETQDITESSNNIDDIESDDYEGKDIDNESSLVEEDQSELQEDQSELQEDQPELQEDQSELQEDQPELQEDQPELQEDNIQNPSIEDEEIIDSNPDRGNGDSEEL